MSSALGMNQATVVNQVLLGGFQLQFDLFVFCRLGRNLRSALTDVGALFLPDEGLAKLGRELVADVAISALVDFFLLAHNCIKYYARP